MVEAREFAIDNVASDAVPATQLMALLDLTRSLGSSLLTREVLQAAVEGVIDVLDLDTGAVYLLHDDTLHLGATSPPLPEDFPEELRRMSPADHPHIERATSMRRLLYVEDASAVKLTPAERTAVEARGLTSLLYVPLLSEGEAIGVFIVGSAGRVRHLSETDVALCAAFSSASALAVVNSRLYASLQATNAELAELNQQLAHRRTQLTSLADALARAADEERRHLAVELNDRVVAPLARLRDGLASGGEGAGVLAAVTEILSAGEDITSRTEPPFLFDAGLKPAVEWLCEHVNESGIDCDVYWDGETRNMPTDVELFAYQATRELLANVERHSHASRASVTIARTARTLEIRVTDDGRGFDTGRHDDPGLGLMSLFERSRLVGAHLEVSSSEGVGTVVTLSIPLT